MILSIISVDLITKQKKTTKVFNLFYIISDFIIMVMKKSKHPFCTFYYSTTRLLFSSLSFLSSLFFSSLGRDVNLLIQCFIQLRVNGVLNIQ